MVVAGKTSGGEAELGSAVAAAAAEAEAWRRCQSRRQERQIGDSAYRPTHVSSLSQRDAIEFLPRRPKEALPTIAGLLKNVSPDLRTAAMRVRMNSSIT